MTVGAPYRESDVVDLVERACPTCGARVHYAAADTSAACDKCDTRFAVSVEHLGIEVRKREWQETPVPSFVSASTPSRVPDLIEEEERRVLEIMGVTCAVLCGLSFILVGAAAGGLALFVSASVLALATSQIKQSRASRQLAAAEKESE